MADWKRCRHLATALLCSLAWLPVAAADYVVGVEDVDYFPIYSMANGHYRGYARELLDLFARWQGIRFKYQPLPVKRMTSYYLTGKVDLVFPDNPRWNTQAKQGQTVNYSDAALTFQDVVLVPPARLGHPLGILGMVRGFTPWKFLPQIKAGDLLVEEAPGPRNLLQMTLLGRVDGANMALQVGRYHLQQMERPDALVADSSLLAISDSQYYLSSIRHPELIQQFNRFLKVEHKAVEQLQRHYGF